jgi:hypothetical protein
MPTPIPYRIHFEKDGENVKASYDLSVRVGDNALIASFSLTLDSKELIDQETWIHGQTRFDGTQFTLLAHPDRDAIVAFSISSNEGWTAADSDTLRGAKRYDDVSFSNS